MKSFELAPKWKEIAFKTSEHFGPLALLLGRVELNNAIAPLVNSIALETLHGGTRLADHSPNWAWKIPAEKPEREVSFNLVNKSGFSSVEDIIAKGKNGDRIEVELPSDEANVGFHISHSLNGDDRGINEFIIHLPGGKENKLIIGGELTESAKSEPLQTLLKYEGSLKTAGYYIAIQKLRRFHSDRAKS